MNSTTTKNSSMLFSLWNLLLWMMLWSSMKDFSEFLSYPYIFCFCIHISSYYSGYFTALEENLPKPATEDSESDRDSATAVATS